ncbi:MAG: N-6 DNA methylase, partial [Gemmatimonadetes bacterium]|nr:N-6 DNA methylase [Gemmatimonadota bacterium]
MTQLFLDLARAHDNRQLFSNHFLDERLPTDPVWNAVEEEAERVRRALRERLGTQRAALEGASERQTEERWIIPVLRELGWGFEVQPVSRRQGSTQFPDYALFASQAEADVAAHHDHRSLLKRGIGVLEAKRWARGLDGRGVAADEDPNRVPSSQIVNYLIRAEQPWGVLTNGGEWRLYLRDADFADTVFFAVDLPALLGDGELALGDAGHTLPAREAFRYFYLFFRPEAFRPTPEGHRWLDLARGASLEYARAVEDALKPRAYRAVTALCRGFAATGAFDPRSLRTDPALAGAVLDNALTLLFRLLFVLYAESRDLLPLRTNPAYRGKSLLALRERAAEARDRGRTLFPRGKDLWGDLHDLFEIVDGDPKWAGLGIPVYNGGLFDPARHPWLEAHYLADPQMAEALDLLSRVEDPEAGGLHFVDYTALDVRHLGSIYEGLLEHALRVADEDLPAITMRGQTVRDAVPRGDLYLAGDRGERHTTGSFYTPDYIVQYVVERTLAPLAEGRSAAEILNLKVLDPAMGSGHFLVAVTSFLARAAVRAAAEGPQPLLGDFAVPDPEHLRRLVVERCIFGVDKNPRAVELAKLALWLATVRRDKPLNFLDHHLRVGDSLVGARLSGMGALPGRGGALAGREGAGQVNVFEGAFRQSLFRALGFLAQIEHLPSDTEEDIKVKEGLFRQADAALDRFREAADVWTSALFGNREMVDAPGREKQVDALADRYARAV